VRSAGKRLLPPTSRPTSSRCDVAKRRSCGASARTRSASGRRLRTGTRRRRRLCLLPREEPDRFRPPVGRVDNVHGDRHLRIALPWPEDLARAADWPPRLGPGGCPGERTQWAPAHGPGAVGPVAARSSRQEGGSRRVTVDVRHQPPPDLPSPMRRDGGRDRARVRGPGPAHSPGGWSWVSAWAFAKAAFCSGVASFW